MARPVTGIPEIGGALHRDRGGLDRGAHRASRFVSALVDAALVGGTYGAGSGTRFCPRSARSATPRL